MSKLFPNSLEVIALHDDQTCFITLAEQQAFTVFADLHA